MKLRYRIDIWGRYIPQYALKDNDYKDFKVKHLGEKYSPIHKIAVILGKHTRWDIIYHLTPNKGESKKDMSVVFFDAINVSAFLGAAQHYYNLSEQYINFEL